MQNARPIPEGMRTVTPQLVCAGAADAIEFYKRAFGAVEMARLPGPQGRVMHAMIRIGDSAVMLVDEMPEWGALSHHWPVATHVRDVSMEEMQQAMKNMAG